MSNEEAKRSESDNNLDIIDPATDGDGNTSDIPPDASNEEDFKKELKEEQKIKFVKVLKQPSTELSHYKRSQLKVSVTDGVVKKAGIFSFAFLSYKVSLDPLGY